MRVNFISADGQTYQVDGRDGQTVRDVAIENSIPGILGSCGGACSCATCHVYVDQEWFERCGTKGQAEELMLDMAWDVKPNSRLGCQIVLAEQLDGLNLHIPERQEW